LHGIGKESFNQIAGKTALLFCGLDHVRSIFGFEALSEEFALMDAHFFP
jgi:hypothetical protein